MGDEARPAPLFSSNGRAYIAHHLDPRHVAALVPCHREPPVRSLVEQVRAFVADVLLVDDGCPAGAARELERLARELEISSLRLERNAGKGHAVATGIDHLLARAVAPRAVLVLDSDGQHPPAAIPAFLEAAAGAELVIGDRSAGLDAMPWERRVANRIANRLLELRTRRPVSDSQCGMRLLRGRALLEVRFPGGRYEAETRHLKACLRGGVQVAWVPIPALYEGHRSSFRSVRDTLRVLAALFG